jgi:hypothetical protein
MANAYPLLMKSRSVAKADILKSGHPKKLKLVSFGSDHLVFFSLCI